MNDLERLDAAVRIIEDLTALCRNITEELSQYRTTDEEEQILNENTELLKSIFRGGRSDE